MCIGLLTESRRMKQYSGWKDLWSAAYWTKCYGINWGSIYIGGKK